MYITYILYPIQSIAHCRQSKWRHFKKHPHPLPLFARDTAVRPPATDLASLAGDGTFFASRARESLGRLAAELAPLAARHDVVVANPPYMGSSNMGAWLGA